MNKIILLFLLTVFLWPWCSAQAGDRILFIPHDDRPISYHQTVEVVEAAGYELVLPPKELLSNATNMGHPQELWQWLRENAPKAKSAVIASDSMLYGGLIPSRNHEVSQAEIAERLENFSTPVCWTREKPLNFRLQRNGICRHTKKLSRRSAKRIGLADVPKIWLPPKSLWI